MPSATGAGPLALFTSFLLMYDQSNKLLQCYAIASLLCFNGFCIATCFLIGLLLPMSDRSILPMRLILLSDF